jgi:hypothetical protein
VVYNRFRRWEARGIWRQLWERLQAEESEVATHVFIDCTIVRAHQHAAGARKKRWVGGTGFGPLSGGFSTKIHAGCLDEKTSVSFELTSSACHGAPIVQMVYEQCPVRPQLAYGVYG